MVSTSHPAPTGSFCFGAAFAMLKGNAYGDEKEEKVKELLKRRK